MKSKRKPKVPLASGIEVHCKFDEIVPASELKLWSEQPKTRNPRKHPPRQLDRYKSVIVGNGYRRSAVVSNLSGCVTKGNGMVQMARREGWSVPIERQNYKDRAAEIKDVIADNKLSDLAQDDDTALRELMGELDPGDIECTAVSEEEFAQLLADAGVTEAEFPITAKLGESYDYVLIFTTNATDHAFLETLLGVRTERSYKKTGIGQGRAIPLARALASLRQNRHSLDVQGAHDDDAPAPSRSGRVRAAKPARRIPPRRRQ